jgi:hypothetical protein
MMLRPDFEQNKPKQRQQRTHSPEAFFAVLYTALVCMFAAHTVSSQQNRAGLSLYLTL